MKHAMLFAVLLLVTAVAVPAFARGGHGGGYGGGHSIGGHYGGGYRGGWVGPAVGLGIGYGIARSIPYYAPAPMYYPPAYYQQPAYVPPSTTYYVERPAAPASQAGCTRETRKIFDERGQSLGTQTFRVCPE